MSIGRYEKYRNTKHNRLTIVEPYIGKNRHGFPRCRCECECGTEIEAVLYDVLRGHTKSCRCLKSEQSRLTGKAHATHGSCGHVLHAVWRGMMERCYNENHQQFRDYGGRGIRVCAEWHDPWAFFSHMGERPSAHATLDRYPNNDGDYEPGNVRWATRTEQGRGKRNNRLVECFGRVQCVAAWAEETGINEGTLRDRLFVQNWSAERALTQPVRKKSTSN